MTENRKRSREEDSCEFMPLSKRINNLHINNNLTSTLSQSSDSSQSSAIAIENGISSPSPLSDSERRPSYDPGINSSENGRVAVPVLSRECRSRARGPYNPSSRGFPGGGGRSRERE
ncbi:jg3964 [Pararge aegeria aegeria]|uniref:Jg3964 protein n=1 Tax=Pararge aegeria aegeria TaxID=348720 RepID=A0A8S4S761_9NEOP|nr:jg3964 [Pararge aegeria aegeria]